MPKKMSFRKHTDQDIQPTPGLAPEINTEQTIFKPMVAKLQSRETSDKYKVVIVTVDELRSQESTESEKDKEKMRLKSKNRRQQFQSKQIFTFGTEFFSEQ